MEDKVFAENMKQFEQYEYLVRQWCKKHQMVYVMPEFKELFDWIHAEAIQNLNSEPKGSTHNTHKIKDAKHP